MPHMYENIIIHGNIWEIPPDVTIRRVYKISGTGEPIPFTMYKIDNGTFLAPISGTYQIEYERNAVIPPPDEDDDEPPPDEDEDDEVTDVEVDIDQTTTEKIDAILAKLNTMSNVTVNNYTNQDINPFYQIVTSNLLDYYDLSRRATFFGMDGEREEIATVLLDSGLIRHYTDKMIGKLVF